MSGPFDDLLAEPLLQPPDYFAHNIMQKINALPENQVVKKTTIWEWLALVSGVLLGAQPLWGFITVAWLAGSAG